MGANTCEGAEFTPYAMNLYGKPVTIDLATASAIGVLTTLGRYPVRPICCGPLRKPGR